MSNFAPPISRDGFVYHGQLHVDAGNLNRHPRASEAELTALLRPTKSAKDTPQKDQVGHWYVAQLKHYGLPQTKDKNAAKVRLLDALNTGKLKVPPGVKRLEAALKKEYDAANRKAKAELKGKPPAAEAATTAPASKRKRGGGDDTTATSTSPTSKKAKTPTKDPEPARKKTAKAGDRPIAPGRSRKTTAAPKTKKALHDSRKGTYYLTVPTVAHEWPALVASTKSVKILLCPDGDKLWGSYNFGPFSGVILFDDVPRGETFHFVWRGTDTSDGGRVKFTTGLGDMRFLQTNRIDGTFYNLYNYRCRFEGKLQGGPRHCPRDAVSFEHEWEDYGQTNDWFGRPPIKVPPAEEPPPGQFARSSSLSALKPAEPRYFPFENPQDMLPKPSSKEDIKPQKKVPSVSSPSHGPVRRASYIQNEHDLFRGSPSAMHSTYDPVNIGQITGIYDIQCPAIEDNWLDSQNNLRLLLCRDSRSSRTWGSFAWGPFFGVIQMNPGPADYSPEPVTLGWRARDEETDGIRFGQGCNGTMEFPEPGTIQGRLFGLYGDFMEFWGQRRPGPWNSGHAPNQFEEEWNSFPSEVYGQRRGSERDAELYDHNGNLNPHGRYSDLLERTLRG